MSIMNVTDRLRNIEPESDSEFCCHPDCWDLVYPNPRVPLCREHMVQVWTFMCVEIGMYPEWTKMAAKAKVEQAEYAASHGRIYIIRFGERVKIGYSTNVKKRLEVLPHEEVLATFPGTRASEAALHRQFRDLRIEGMNGREWFQLDQRILDLVAEHAA